MPQTTETNLRPVGAPVRSSRAPAGERSGHQPSRRPTVPYSLRVPLKAGHAWRSGEAHGVAIARLSWTHMAPHRIVKAQCGSAQQASRRPAVPSFSRQVLQSCPSDSRVESVVSAAVRRNQKGRKAKKPETAAGKRQPNPPEKGGTQQPRRDTGRTTLTVDRTGTVRRANRPTQDRQASQAPRHHPRQPAAARPTAQVCAAPFRDHVWVLSKDKQYSPC